MKRLINSLSIISVIAAFGLILADIFLNDKSPRMSFIFSYSMAILVALAIPFLLGSFSLAVNKNKISPKIWLAIYGTAIFAYIIIAINLGFVDMTKDLPLALRGEFSQINGSAQIIQSNQSMQIIEVGGVRFHLSTDEINAVEASKHYTFVYLPNSEYVIDIIDETGISLVSGKKKH